MLGKNRKLGQTITHHSNSPSFQLEMTVIGALCGGLT